MAAKMKKTKASDYVPARVRVALTPGDGVRVAREAQEIPRRSSPRRAASRSRRFRASRAGGPRSAPRGPKGWRAHSKFTPPYCSGPTGGTSKRAERRARSDEPFDPAHARHAARAGRRACGAPRFVSRGHAVQAHAGVHDVRGRDLRRRQSRRDVGNVPTLEGAPVRSNRVSRRTK